MSGFELTAEEAKVEYVAKMGPEVGSLYAELWQQVARIHCKWTEYVALFGTSPERIDLLNRAAPSFIGTVQDTLWDDVLLHLARLTDSPRSFGKENLSICRLAMALTGSAIEASTTDAIDIALKACGFARDSRNRRLAHLDLDLALGQSALPLAPASRLAVKEALAALEGVLNVVSQHFLNSNSLFSTGPDDTGAISLLYLLRDGLNVKEERLARIKSGQYRPSDFGSDPL
ncbi:AbiU2 domain-containing protein [Hydrogenophaga palleronii]|uniref:AbiU2 domain-containing protein n=1 Tax=Hydrogenophaga palleronii TaxID=65655 RepID=UPI000826E346|nr:hypothetical protein [Hydrogenophaga palleronii]